MAYHQANPAKIAPRGTELYCAYRAPIEPTATRSKLPYPILSPGQHCECVTPHEFEREPSTWESTPAETECDACEAGREEGKRLKTVRFVASVVTEVRYFEKWWCDEYRDSGRYWSRGPHRRSVDQSTAADDELEIEGLENPGGLVGRVLEGEESADGDDGIDEDILMEMERANEAWDEEGIWEEMIESEELWDEETLSDEMENDSKELHESLEDQF
ncbi:hypothetical protein IMSHALPRED_008804 [Imshaugia aleurites]|uniref:Uncharacterized protein n=1 Tax=Imshaugia aleurites TaxID=172621 RepID=A0A8H3IU04_9LECA|nr:hypothetical protein IMSHALPRED_008804 [Imshaugia aleurites]